MTIPPVLKEYLLLVIIVIFISVFWYQPVVIPIKILVVFFHESSHALTTLLTGGEVVELVITADQGGHVLSRGGNRFWALTSGYLGSLLWGVIIYLSALLTRLDHVAMGILSIAIVAIALLFITDGFALTFCLVSGGLMMVCAIWFSNQINDFILRLIGVTSLLYVPLDIYSDTIHRSHLRSDAFMLAEEFGGTGWAWGGVWLLISLIVIFFTIKVGHGKIHQSSQETNTPVV